MSLPLNSSQIHICSNCHLTIMEIHPELAFWYKCQICGFCLEVKKEIQDVHRITGNDTG